jgi:ABC-2 type transport system ATP-binding protein
MSVATSATPAAIEAERVSKRFGRLVALDQLSLRVAKGQVYALLGPNGAGKTTLIRAILGLTKPDGGEVRVLGRRMPERVVLGRIGYMTQAAALYADLTAEENVRFFAAIAGGGDVEAALRFVDLLDRRRSVTATLSGGMRTRLSLACALVHRPEVLVLDEPTVGVDPHLRAQMWDGLREMAASGATILITTHVMDEASRADRLGLILAGRLIAEGTESELLARAGSSHLEDAFLRLAEVNR